MNINDLAVKVEALTVRMENIEEISRDAKKDRTEMLARQERIEDKLDTRVRKIETKIILATGALIVIFYVFEFLIKKT